MSHGDEAYTSFRRGKEGSQDVIPRCLETRFPLEKKKEKSMTRGFTTVLLVACLSSTLIGSAVAQCRGSGGRSGHYYGGAGYSGVYNSPVRYAAPVSYGYATAPGYNPYGGGYASPANYGAPACAAPVQGYYGAPVQSYPGYGYGGNQYQYQYQQDRGRRTRNIVMGAIGVAILAKILSR